MVKTEDLLSQPNSHIVKSYRQTSNTEEMQSYICTKESSMTLIHGREPIIQLRSPRQIQHAER